jgi:hypothetical protein
MACAAGVVLRTGDTSRRHRAGITEVGAVGYCIDYRIASMPVRLNITIDEDVEDWPA